MQALDIINRTLEDIKTSGLYKTEREIGSSQQPEIKLGNGRQVLNMCANNYLGLANHPEIIAAAEAGLKQWGFGLASVRFICGTQSIHKKLESELSNFLGTEDTILYSSCFDANGGLFETLLGEEDAVISDELNHASIIDGIRLCKARRLRYKNRCVSALEEQLKEAAGARIRLIATDGVFSMDGSYAPLDDICALAQKYDALVMVDDSHACGFTGSDGSGTPAMFGVRDQVHIVTGTLGKALGGAGGGFTSGRQEIIDLLRQRSRPYLFSNTLSPAIVCASLKALELAWNPELREKLKRNTVYFRNGMAQAGFDVPPGEHPIVPIMLGDAVRAANMAEQLMRKNIYAVGFFYPVVPMGKARIRVQISAAHTIEELDRAIAAFAALK
jgi:glycine C-acetyltransferase